MTKAIALVGCLFGLSGCLESCDDAEGAAARVVFYDQDWSQRREGQQGCCRLCDPEDGYGDCACGDACIPCEDTCNADPGCACNSEEDLSGGCGVR